MRIHILTSIFILISISLSGQVPINDSPCYTDPNPPYDLTTELSHVGNTCGATSFESILWCPGLPNHVIDPADIWYNYTISGSFHNYIIRLTNQDATGPISVRIFDVSLQDACNEENLEIWDEILIDCFDDEFTFEIIDCDIGTSNLLIGIGTNLGGCGNIEIEIEVQEYDVLVANNCEETAGQFELNPSTGEEVVYNECINSDVTIGCENRLDFSPKGCSEFWNQPTQWFQINVDDQAAQLYSTVTTTGNWTPVWSVFTGSCDDLFLSFADGVQCNGQPLTSSSGPDDPSEHNTGVYDQFDTYWIAVSYLEESIPAGGIQDGTYELCVSTVDNEITCMGQESNCLEESLVIEVVSREFDQLSFDGPFCQGEEVEIHISFIYDTSESENWPYTTPDFFNGIIPRFGQGWDLDNVDFEIIAPVATLTTFSYPAEWYEEGGACAPLLKDDLEHVCTYIDDDGRLVFCNGLCEPCPCDLGMEYNDPLPSGYFWVNNGSEEYCTNDCSPGEGFGQIGVMLEIEWNLTLTTKEFENSEDCLLKKDLSIDFQTFTDAITGCYDNPLAECALDKMQFSPDWEINCEELYTPDISASVICIGETIEVTGYNYGPGDITSSNSDVLDVDSGSLTGLTAGFVTITVDVIDISCDIPVTFDIQVAENYSVNENVTICEGESYFNFTETGSYMLDLVSEYGCDSIVNLELTVIPVTTINNSLEICQGSSIIVNGNTYFQTGLYIDTVFMVGCIDTLIVTDLMILPPPIENIEVTICDGDSYLGYTEPGIYTLNLITALDCDSIVNINLTVEELLTGSQYVSICEGDEIEVNGNIYNTPGVYIDTVYSDLECPVLIDTITVSIDSLININLNETICSGDSLFDYSESGNYIIEISGSGCDSIINLDLTVIDITEIDIVDEICQGDSLVVNGIVYYESGNYSDTTYTQNCTDTIFNTFLSVSPLLTDSIDIIICEGDSFMTFFSSGNFIDTLTNFEGCDSLLYINLLVEHLESNYRNVMICDGDEIEINGTVYNQSGVYIDTLYSDYGCPLLIDTINISLDSLIEVDIDQTICDGDTYLGYGETGNYIIEIMDGDDCDSIINLNLNVISSSIVTDQVSICEGDSVLFLNDYYTEPGIYSDTVFLGNCFDSIFNLEILSMPSPMVSIIDTICEGESYMGFDSTGTYLISIPAEIGCDTMLTLELEVLPTDDPDCLIDAVGDLDTEKFKIYPNPTDGLMYIDTVLKVQSCMIYDLSGRRLPTQLKIIDGKTVMDVADFQSGLYILLVQQKNGQLSAYKFVKS